MRFRASLVRHAGIRTERNVQGRTAERSVALSVPAFTWSASSEKLARACENGITSLAENAIVAYSSLKHCASSY